MKDKTYIDKIIKQLKIEYGERPWQPHHDPMSELVLTILSQNTSDKNSRPAFQQLVKSFPSWDEVLQANPQEIAEAIKSGGLAQIKAVRIQTALQEIKSRLGKFDLNILMDMPLDAAKTWLKMLPGVGDKTAACVLLFALGRPALPVDTHVYRVSARLGLLPARSSLNEAHITLERKLAPDQVYQFHVTMIEHGRQVCTARRPYCEKCVLSELCPNSSKSLISAKEHLDA